MSVLPEELKWLRPKLTSMECPPPLMSENDPWFNGYDFGFKHALETVLRSFEESGSEIKES